MKKITFTIFITFLFIISKALFSQNANWGTGLPVTVTVNGTDLYLSVFDPIQNQTKNSTLNVGNNPVYKNSDGVVVGYGSYGDMRYATYDVELHSWKSGVAQLGGSNTQGTVLTADGVVVGYGSYGDMRYATYDVELHSWKSGVGQLGGSNTQGTVLTADGVVVGYGSYGDMRYATYDVESQIWKTGVGQLGGSNTQGTVLTADGVVVGYGSYGDMRYAIYDIQIQSWRSSVAQLSASNAQGTILTSDGVVAGYGSYGDLRYAIYDFNLNSWRTGMYNLGNSGNFTLNSGTISYSGSSSGIKGYNSTSQTWGSYNTDPSCKLLPVTNSNSAWVFMRCMSMGASSFTYSCGDGHQIYRRQGWKKYGTINQFNSDLTVSNGVNNTSCDAVINITTGMKVNVVTDFGIYPNPTTGSFNVQFHSPIIAEITICNILGETVSNRNIANENKVSFDLSSNGTYFVIVTTKEGTLVKKTEKIN